MVSLFRPEVGQHRQQAWLGSVQLIRPVSLAWLTGLVTLVAAAVAGFLATGEYTRKAHVTGYLVPDRGLLRLMPPEVSTVAESRVVEGQHVKRGDVLFVLSTDRTSLSGDTQLAVQASLATRRQSLQAAARQRELLQQQQLAGMTGQADDLRRELTQLDVEADLQRQRLDLAEKALARLESLKADNFVSAGQVQAKHEEVLSLRAQAQGLARQRAALDRDLHAIDTQRLELPLRTQAEQGVIERDLAGLGQAAAENAARQQVVVRAPQDGVVSGVMAQVGHSVSPASALASLLPADARLQAQLFAPSSAIGFLRPQQRVQLRYQAFPYQKFGHQSGAVLQVSRTPLQAAELAALSGSPPPTTSANGTALAEPLYRITVALERQDVLAYGQAQPLAPGMQIDADVLLDRRRLIEWVFEPLLSISGRL